MKFIDRSKKISEIFVLKPAIFLSMAGFCKKNGGNRMKSKERSIQEIEQQLGLTVKQYSLFLFLMEGVLFDYFGVNCDIDIAHSDFPTECATEVLKIMDKLLLSEEFSDEEQKDFQQIKGFIQKYYRNPVMTTV